MHHRRHSSLSIRHISILTVTITSMAFSANGVKAEQKMNSKEVISVEDFLRSLGICIHYAQGVSAQSYVEPLRYIAVRNIRDGMGDPQGYKLLKEQTGVRADLLVDPNNFEESINKLKVIARGDALLAVEGPNEPNNFPIKYSGEVGGGMSKGPAEKADWAPVARFQRDLYAAVKQDATLSGIAVFNTSEAGAEEPNVGLQFLTIPKDGGATFPAGTKYADFANVHNYVSSTKRQYVDNQAWNAADPNLNGAWDGLYVEYGKLWRGGYQGYDGLSLQTLPRVTTESGWDSVSDIGGEDTQGRVLLNTYLSQFKRGWRYTFIYMLRDGEGGAGNQGVFHSDSTPKLAAQYIHNLTTILSKNEDITTTSNLLFHIDTQSSTTHTMLLRSANERFALMVWGERVYGEEEVPIYFDEQVRAVDIYDPTLGTELISHSNSTKNISIKISDHPVILMITK